MAEISWNRPRTIEALRIAANAWDNKLGLFANIESPEDSLIQSLPPETNLLLQAQVLFTFVKLNLSGERAWTIVKQVRDIFYHARWIIDPAHMYQADLFNSYDYQFRQLIRMSGMRPELFDWWTKGLKMLRKEGIDNDPRNLFYRSDGTRLGIIKSLSAFPGIGHKIAQMQALDFQTWAQGRDPQLRDFFENVAEAFIAVDIWWMRLMRQWGCVDDWGSDRRDRISFEMSHDICAMCREAGISHLSAGQGVWHTGSLVCGALRPKRNDGFSALWCLRNCPMNSLCERIVRADRAQTNRGSMGWDTAVDRVKILEDPQMDLISLNGGDRGRTKLLATANHHPPPTPQKLIQRSQGSLGFE